MVVSMASLKVTDNIVIQIRIFINRKQILQNYDKATTLFEAPLLSNNSIISLKSPGTGIYLSNIDMQSLCEDLKEEIRLILYDLTAPNISKTVLQKIRVGQKIDFQTRVLEQIQDNLGSASDTYLKSNIKEISRISKFKYVLHYESNWKLDIFIDNISKLATIRQLLVFKYSPTVHVPHKRRMLIVQKSSVAAKKVVIPDESDMNELGEESTSVQNETMEDIKPEIAFKYKAIRNLGPIMDVHVLERPRRHPR
ncbi:hypothetical protein C6P45_005105 [Maudiozyma exigua]|uniref:Uncharacterized protein n=1 Tax=Maudiozyma exigua TaxID=34358 RepID=A0A9P6WA47_MAUEX|nr:hypothetical protein C6P45_005105 [Kazachstania exigua]